MKALKSDLSTVMRGLREIHGLCRGLLLLTVVGAVFDALSPFINIYMSALILNAIVDSRPFGELMMYAVTVAASNMAVKFISGILSKRIGLKRFTLSHNFDLKLGQKVINMDYETVEDAKTHMLKAKIDEVKNLNNGGLFKLADSFQTLTRNIFMIIFSVSLTFSLFTATGTDSSDTVMRVLTSPLTSAVLCAAIVASVFVGMHANAALTKRMYGLMHDIIPFNRMFGYYFENYITSYHVGKDIRLYNEKDLILNEEMSLMGDVNRTLRSLSENQMKYQSLITAASVGLNVMIYLFVGFKALAGLFSVGSVLQYISSINEFTGGFSGLITELSAIRLNNEAMNYYFEFIDLPAKRQNTDARSIDTVDIGHAGLEMKDVSFRYPGTEEYVLRHVDLRIEKGERVAIVGENGSGKTTLVKLLCRLYDPTDGEILIGGENIDTLRCDEYQGLFSVVFQDFKLFSFSIGQNVAASVSYDAARVESCLRKSGFAERLSRMKDGIDTYLYKDFEESGVEISGGEEQKIAMARALYRDAPIIILDEPTAALDPKSESELFMSFGSVVGDKTAVFISHRLSSCRFCDKIVVLDHGQLVQYGSHDELLKDESGKYYELWNAQARYYVEQTD